MEEVKKYKLENDERIESGTYIRDSSWDEDGEYYYIVGINNWIINSDGKFLVQRRALTKKNNPGKWSSTNGLIQLQEEGVDTVQRETKEELGVELNPRQIFLFRQNQIAGDHLLVDIYVSHADINLDDITTQESEVDKVALVSLEKLLSLDVSSTCSYIKEFGNDILKAFRNHFGKKQEEPFEK